MGKIMDIDTGTLTPLMDFPGYFIDTETARVYSTLQVGRRKLTQAREINFSSLNGKDNPQTNFMVDGKYRRVALYRLMASTLYGVSYDKLPSDVSFKWDSEHGLRLFAPQDLRHMGWEEKKRARMASRIREIDEAMKTMQLLRTAYQGDLRPLTIYVYDRKGYYARRLQEDSVYFGLDVVYWAVDEAINLLYAHVNDGSGSVFALDAWIVKTAKGLIRKRGKDRHLLVRYNDNIKQKEL